MFYLTPQVDINVICSGVTPADFVSAELLTNLNIVLTFRFEKRSTFFWGS